MDEPVSQRGSTREANVFEMPGSPTEDIREETQDYRELRLRASEVLVHIRAQGYNYNRSYLDSYETRELEIYKSDITGSERDRRLFDAYAQTVLQPVYEGLEEDARKLVGDQVEGLLRYTSNADTKRINIKIAPSATNRIWDEEVSPIESLSKGPPFSRIQADSVYTTGAHNSRAAKFVNNSTTVTDHTRFDDIQQTSTPVIRHQREWPKSDTDSEAKKLPESLRKMAEELNPRKKPQEDLEMGYISGPIDWRADPNLFGHLEEHPTPKEEPKDTTAILEGSESLLADYEELAVLEQGRLQTLESLPEENDLELPLYRAILDHAAGNSGEITLMTGDLVSVSAMSRPTEDGAAWWLVQLMRGQRTGTGNYGWVSSSILTIALEYTEIQDDDITLHRQDSLDAPEVRIDTLSGTPRISSQIQQGYQPIIGHYHDHHESIVQTEHIESLVHPAKPHKLLRQRFNIFSLSWSFKSSHKQQVSPIQFSNAIELPAMEYTFRPFASHPPKKHAIRSTLIVSDIQSQTTKLLFGERLCNPQYHELSYTYMAQLNESASKAIKDSRIVLSQMDWLVKVLHLVSLRMDCTASIKSFTTTWRGLPVFSGIPRDSDGIMADLISLTENSENNNCDTSENIPEGIAAASNVRFANVNAEKRAYELLTFIIESWLMVDLTGFCGLFDHPDHPLLSAPIEVALGPMLPQHADSITLEHSTKQLLAPVEMSAIMLHDWKGLHFKWTSKTAEHLSYTQSTGEVKLYGHIAYCFLHALAGSDSSLLKRGFIHHHAALVEIAATYRLLFGADPEARILFTELDVKNRLPGYFDIFDELPPADTQPRLHYLLVKDFPIYGERLLALRLLLRPTGLRSLWKDKRDSLQWYTFWAVVFVGVLGIGLALIQIGLGAVQAYASMAALKQGQNHKRSYPPPTITGD